MHIIGIALILFGVVLYFLKPEERAHVGRACLGYVRGQKETLLRRWRERDDLPDDGRVPEPMALIVPALVVANLGVFVRMLLAGGALADESTLVSWGANFGPRTTNGEWSRLFSSMFVHSGFLHLLADLCGLVAIGVLAERFAGRLSVTVVYFAAGTLAGLVALAESAIVPHAGAAGGIVGLFGLFLAVWLWSAIQRDPIAIPLRALKILGLMFVIFIAYNMATGRLSAGLALAPFISGFVAGLVLSIGVEEDDSPALRRVAAVAASAIVLALGFALPLRGLSDVRPAIAQIIALEGETADMYQTAVVRFTAGHIQPKALAKVIDGKIAPALNEAAARLKAFQHVPPEHQPMVAAAGEYVRLRSESWRLRSDALQKSNMRALQTADRLEWQSLEALEALKQISHQ